MVIDSMTPMAQPDGQRQTNRNKFQASLLALKEWLKKTEFTLVQLDCIDAQKHRRLVLLLVWPFGVRKMVSNDEYPATYDAQDFEGMSDSRPVCGVNAGGMTLDQPDGFTLLWSYGCLVTRKKRRWCGVIANVWVVLLP